MILKIHDPILSLCRFPKSRIFNMTVKSEDKKKNTEITQKLVRIVDEERGCDDRKIEHLNGEEQRMEKVVS